MGSPRQLFGTDGVRGPVPEFLNADVATKLGRAAVAALAKNAVKVLVVRDTRSSSAILEAALAAGIAEAGGDVSLAGVLPTPAASLLVRRYGFDLAAVISASHNPFSDNGIKFFDSNGCKLSASLEATVEKKYADSDSSKGECGSIRAFRGGDSDYVRGLTSAFDLDLSGRKIALDCAHGATYLVAPRIFRQLGLEPDVVAAAPDGRNINDGVGSTHIEQFCDHVVARECELGFAFDGDGDRVIAVTGKGDVLDGDDILALAAQFFQNSGELGSGGVALTVMSNFGLVHRLQQLGIEVATTDVGDKYVSERLTENGWVLGGEPSGHIINTNVNPTGDGVATALLLLKAADALDFDFTERPFQRWPQSLESVSVVDREALERADTVWQAVEEEKNKLDGNGRVLVRSSGTESVVRVMVEAPTQDVSDAACQRLSKLVDEVLG